MTLRLRLSIFGGGTIAALTCANAIAAGLTVEPVAPARSLQCPEILGGYQRVLSGPERCEYSAESGAAAALRLTRPSDAVPDPEGAFLSEATLPGGWRGRIYHLGETQAGDGRLERWSAPANGLRLQIEIRYQIPAVSPAEARALVAEAGAVNSVTMPPAETAADAGGDCADTLAGFALEHPLTTRTGGASVLSGCAYVSGAMTALVYTARSADQAMEDFISMQPQDAETAPGPGRAGYASHIVKGEGIHRGVWIADGEGAVRVVEADWPDDADSAPVQRFLNAIAD